MVTTGLGHDSCPQGQPGAPVGARNKDAREVGTVIDAAARVQCLSFQLGGRATIRNEDRLIRMVAAGFLLMPRRPSRSELVNEIVRLNAELRHGRRVIQHLRIENEVLREAAEPLIHHAPARERFAFIHAARPPYGAERITRELRRQGIEAGQRRVAG